jgi:glycerophosphoryl diester phosphodiesterase
MRNLLLVSALALLACAPPPRLPRVDDAQELGRFSLMHAHNDYEHQNPLEDALVARFESVEADLWLQPFNGIGVSHLGFPVRGSLKKLYLEPLAALVAANGGSVHGDGRPFFLWLELKDNRKKLQDLLAKELANYDFLTQFDDQGEIKAGAVTVIILGDERGKKRMVDFPAPRPFTRDSHHYAPDDPPVDGKWGYYSLPYSDFMRWNGRGTIPDSEREQLENLVNGAHALGRPIRLYGNPETPEYWNAARDAHMDFINTDKLRELSAVTTQTADTR